MHETIIELSSTVRIHMREFTLGSASEMTYIVSGGALNSTHSLTRLRWVLWVIVGQRQVATNS